MVQPLPSVFGRPNPIAVEATSIVFLIDDQLRILRQLRDDVDGVGSNP